MESKSVFVHIGVTVTDIDVFADFYCKHFGFELLRRGVFSEEFIADTPELFDLKAGAYSDFAFLSSPNGVSLELFQFNELIDAEKPVWNRPGYHHICLRVESVPETYRELCKAGVEFYFEPKPMMRNKDAYWAFLKDPDGNMVELQDLKPTVAVDGGNKTG